ncbi:MAG: DUF4870 domain-containing protein [Phycisphaerales bacterium]|nr:DUF4870 domain-containing protein [Phycisphaerales bacterium]
MNELPEMTPPSPTSSPGTPRPDAGIASLAFWAFVIPIPFASLIIPIVLLNTKGKESKFVRETSIEAINFLIFCFIVGVAGGILVLVLVGIFVLIALYVYSLIICLVAAIQTMSATEDTPPYRIPFTIRLIN